MKKLLFVLFFYLFTAANFVCAQTVGLLYGMTSSSGPGGYGTLFSFDPLTGKDSVRINFDRVTNGSSSSGSLIQLSNGLLYGMTSGGGAMNDGILFSFDPQTGKDSVLADFVVTNGSTPMGSLIIGKDGLLYGMTSAGGANNQGCLFRFNIVTGIETVLFNFDNAHGITPNGSLIQDTSGVLYGMTSAGGANNMGALFSFNLSTLTDSVLFNFDNAHGTNPQGGVTYFNGILYGMTKNGGPTGNGVLFSYNLLTGYDSVLFSFTGNNGLNPYGSLLLISDSLLYGLTSNASGATAYGTLFQYSIKNGKDSVLIFDDSIGSPFGSLLKASNGLFYGMSRIGGRTNGGVLFNYNSSNGKDSALFNFNNTSGINPYGDLTEIMYASVKGTDSIHCFGDTASNVKVTVRGAKLPITYLWSTGATTDSISGLKGGIYTCTITDARGISFTISDTIKQPTQIFPNLTVTNGCMGSYGTASINPRGGTPPFTYIWNNKDTTMMIDSLMPGNDTCVITDSKGCSIKAIAIIQQAAPLKIDSIVPVKTTCPLCNDGSVKVYVSGGIPLGDSIYYIYNWGNGSDSSTIHNLDTGSYSVCVYSPYGCSQGGVCDSTMVIAGINNIQLAENTVVLYPVPSKGDLSILLKGNGYEMLNIYDELGKRIINQALDSKTVSVTVHIDLRGQANGVYILQITNREGLITRKILLQK